MVDAGPGAHVGRLHVVAHQHLLVQLGRQFPAQFVALLDEVFVRFARIEYVGGEGRLVVGRAHGARERVQLSRIADPHEAAFLRVFDQVKAYVLVQEGLIPLLQAFVSGAHSSLLSLSTLSIRSI